MSIPVANHRWALAMLATASAWGMFAHSAVVAGDECRLLFLGPDAPKILQATISAGRYSVSQTRQKYAEALFKQLDRNQSGTLEAEEAAQIPADGRFRAQASTLGEDWKVLDTAPQDSRASIEELSGFLDKLGGPPISVVKQPPRLAQTVRLQEDLDLNHDGRIDADEVKQGLSVLHAFDFDDDETLSVAELQPFPLSVLQAQRQEQARDEPIPLLLLSTEDEFTEAAKRMRAQYGNDKDIPRERMPGLDARRFGVFDADRDGRWSQQELLVFLRQAPADSIVGISLAPPKVSTKTPSTEPKRTLLDLGGVPVEFRAENTAYQQFDSVQLYKVNFLRSDADKNGYLDPREFAGMQAGDVQFASVDLDGNGQVTVNEIEQFFVLDGLARQRQLLISLSDEARTLFDVIDADSDRRLSPREFLEARDRLLAYDRNHDGALVRTEFASQFRMTFAQPKLLDDLPDGTMAMMRGNRAPPIVENTSQPLWFRRMDRNGDNEISWREFLGPRQTFESLDLDHDGFINSAEGQSAEHLRTAQ